MSAQETRTVVEHLEKITSTFEGIREGSGEEEVVIKGGLKDRLDFQR